jgi:hypothetical protein
MEKAGLPEPLTKLVAKLLFGWREIEIHIRYPRNKA